MEQMSYGQSSIFLVVSVLAISSVVLDLLPLLYMRLCRAFVASPIDFSSRCALLLTLLLTAGFLL